jgi:hypothetical protein
VDERGGVGCGAARRGRGPGLRICAAAADVPCTWLVLREHGPKDLLALDRLSIHPAYDIAPAPSMSAASISRVYGREESVENMRLSFLFMIIQHGMQFFPMGCNSSLDSVLLLHILHISAGNCYRASNHGCTFGYQQYVPDLLGAGGLSLLPEQIQVQLVATLFKRNEDSHFDDDTQRCLALQVVNKQKTLGC